VHDNRTRRLAEHQADCIPVLVIELRRPLHADLPCHPDRSAIGKTDQSQYFSGARMQKRTAKDGEREFGGISMTRCRRGQTATGIVLVNTTATTICHPAKPDDPVASINQTHYPLTRSVVLPMPLPPGHRVPGGVDTGQPPCGVVKMGRRVAVDRIKRINIARLLPAQAQAARENSLWSRAKPGGICHVRANRRCVGHARRPDGRRPDARRGGNCCRKTCEWPHGWCGNAASTPSVRGRAYSICCGQKPNEEPRRKQRRIAASNTKEEAPQGAGNLPAMMKRTGSIVSPGSATGNAAARTATRGCSPARRQATAAPVAGISISRPQ